MTFVWISSVKYVRSPLFLFLFPLSHCQRDSFCGFGSHKVLPAASHCCHCFFRPWLYDFFCMRVGGRLRRSLVMCSFSSFSVLVLSCHRTSTIEEEEGKKKGGYSFSAVAFSLFHKNVVKELRILPLFRIHDLLFLFLAIWRRSASSFIIQPTLLTSEV